MAVLMLWALQRELIYAPDSVSYVPPSHYEMLDGVEEIFVRSEDGLMLRSWYARAPAGQPTVVLFPGKSASLRGQRYRIRHFMNARMGVLLLGYRGYSGNAGTPTERGFHLDAEAALDWLHARDVSARSIVLYGISLGSGVAMQMAAEHPHAALILEAPYTSVADLAVRRFPFFPVRWLLRDNFDTLTRIGLLSQPLLVMHGGRDTVIPQRHGRTLYDAATVQKEGFWPPAAGHNDVFDRGGFDAAVDFIERSLRLHARAAA